MAECRVAREERAGNKTRLHVPLSDDVENNATVPGNNVSVRARLPLPEKAIRRAAGFPIELKSLGWKSGCEVA